MPLQQQFFDAEAMPFGITLEGGIQAGDVGLVMLVVMYAHGRRVDAGLERVVSERQWRQGKRIGKRFIGFDLHRGSLLTNIQGV
jgi:hypothetical protein